MYKNERFFARMYGELKRFNPVLDLETEDGEIIKGALVVGNDECYDGDEFYQYALTTDKVYRAYYEITEIAAENGLDLIDYSKPYRIEEATEEFEDEDLE